MKVLFAVSNENISEAIIKRYKEKYNELITYKNVYYFNAVIKELQTNKTYDRIVISEDLEIFSNSNEISIDKFLINKLSRILDESKNAYGNDVPLIFISSEKRKFGTEQLSEYFSLGIYNVLIGNDRTITKICELINQPRRKEEALDYYKIDVEINNKKIETDPVSSIEIKNILRFYRGIASNPEKFSDTFDRIVVQYNDEQLRYIIQKLPMTVKIVLEENNQNYRNLMSGKAANSRIVISDQIKNKAENEEKKIESKVTEENHMENPEKQISTSNLDFTPEENNENLQQNENIINQNVGNNMENELKNNLELENSVEEENEKQEQVMQINNQEETDEDLISSDVLEEYRKQIEDTSINIDNLRQNPIAEEQNKPNNFSEKEKEENFEIDIDNIKHNANNDKAEYIKPNLEGFLNDNKRIIAFTGTSKNGVSFLINSVAVLLSSVGVKTAILDMTTNRNSYYLATSSDKDLKNKANKIFENLEKGNADGIEITNTLSIFTAVPDNGKIYRDAENMYKTLLQEFDLVLVDTDFNTNYSFFSGATEIFLVQSLDILTMQSLTRFLKNLKDENIINNDNIKVVINKEIPLKGISRKVIVGGISTYNNPSMSYMTKLFDKDLVKICAIPFEQVVYQKYLENIIYCKYDISGYPKKFIEDLKILASLVYPKYKTGVSSQNNVNKNQNQNIFENNNQFKQKENSFQNENAFENRNLNISVSQNPYTQNYVPKQNINPYENNNGQMQQNNSYKDNQNNNLNNNQNQNNNLNNYGGFYGFKNRMPGQNYEMQNNQNFNIQTTYKPENIDNNYYQQENINQKNMNHMNNMNNMNMQRNKFDNYTIGRNYNMYNSPNPNFQNNFYQKQNRNVGNYTNKNQDKKRFSEKVSDSLNKMKSFFGNKM